MSDVIEINPTAPVYVEINPSTPAVVEVNPLQSIVLIEVTAPGGFGGGLGVEAFQFSRNALSVSIGGVPLTLDGDYEVESYTIGCGTAPVGAAIICDINKNGVSIFTTQSHRPTIASGQTVGSTTAPDIMTFSAGDRITIDIDQVGSTSPGAGLEINLRLRRTS